MAYNSRHYTSPAIYLKARNILHPKQREVMDQVLKTRQYLKTVGNEASTDFIVLPSGQIVELTADGLFYWNTQAAPVSNELRRTLWFLRQDRSRLLRQGFIYIEYKPSEALSLQLADSAIPYLTYSFKNILGLARRLRVSKFKVQRVKSWQGYKPQGPIVEGSETVLRDWFRRAGGYMP